MPMARFAGSPEAGAPLQPLPLPLRSAVEIDFGDVVSALENDGFEATRDLGSVPLPEEARVELGTDRVGAVVYVRGPLQHLFVATLDPPHRGIHVVVDDWTGTTSLRERRELEIVEQTALGVNPLLALTNMNRQQIAEAFEALARKPSKRAISALCYHAANNPEDLFAVTTAVKAGADAESLLIDQLREPSEGAVEAAVYLLGEIGDDVAYAAIDALHLWDRGVYAEAMKKIRARRARPQERREDAIQALAAKLAPFAWPAPARASESSFGLWDLEALLVAHEPRDSAWWHVWGDDAPPNARPFAQLALDQDGARISRAGQTLFEVTLDRETIVETMRVPTPPALEGVLVRVSRDAGYRARKVAEIGVLVAHDAGLDAFPKEDRRDVLFLAPSDATSALAFMQAGLDGVAWPTA
jgi:hypothetical protein